MIERTVGGLHEHLFGLLEDTLAGERGRGILDIGCGTGAWLERTKKLGFESNVGIDYDQPEPVSGLDLRKFDINHDSAGTLGKFNVVTCIEVIEHIENIGKLLDLVRETLDRNGFAIITTPNIESLRARVRALASGKIPSFDKKSDPTHLCPILHESLKKMLNRRRLSIFAIHKYPENRTKSLMFGKPVTRLSNILRYFLPDDLYGDNNIFFIRHEQDK